jgi:hypothetical protein
MEGGKTVLVSKIVIDQQTYGCGKERNYSLRLSSLLLSYMNVNFGVARSIENHGRRLRRFIFFL